VIFQNKILVLYRTSDFGPPDFAESLMVVAATPSSSGGVAAASLPLLLAATPIFLPTANPAPAPEAAAAGPCVRPEHYQVLFMHARLGLGLKAGERDSEVPVVTASPPDMPLPVAGDFLESVNWQLLRGYPDPYAEAIALITACGRPLTIGFARAPAAPVPLAPAAAAPTPRADGTYDVVFTHPSLGLDLLADEANVLALPVVSSVPPGSRHPTAGHALVSINGLLLHGAHDPYAKAIDLITSAGRPITIGFAAATPAAGIIRASRRGASSATSSFDDVTGGYEVVFTAAKLGMGLRAAENPAQLPEVLAAPELGNGGLPRAGDFLVSVNGVPLLGAPDTYGFAIGLITGSRRPVTIGFLPSISN
jgi:hypothetical protein